MESLRDREVASATSDHQGSNFESCVRRAESFHSSHHPKEVLLAQFSPHVHKGGLKPHSFHLVSKILVIFTHLKLWVAVARHNFKWVGILIRKWLNNFYWDWNGVSVIWAKYQINLSILRSDNVHGITSNTPPLPPPHPTNNISPFKGHHDIILHYNCHHLYSIEASVETGDIKLSYIFLSKTLTATYRPSHIHLIVSFGLTDCEEHSSQFFSP